MYSLQLTVGLLVGCIAFANAFQAPSIRANSVHTSIRMAVESKSVYKITLLTGDGIGPEIMAATLPVLEAIGKKGILFLLISIYSVINACKIHILLYINTGGFKFDFKEADIGGIAIDKHNDPFPESSLAQCKASDSILLACIGGYKWDNNPRHLRPESGLLKMRKELGLFANLRPAKVLPQLIDASTLKREVIEGVDIMVVRELTGGIYFGTPKGIETDPVTGFFFLSYLLLFFAFFIVLLITCLLSNLSRARYFSTRPLIFIYIYRYFLLLMPPLSLRLPLLLHFF